MKDVVKTFGLTFYQQDRIYEEKERFKPTLSLEYPSTLQADRMRIFLEAMTVFTIFWSNKLTANR